MGGVFVYKNLHKDCWSVRSNKTKLVVAHRKNLILKDCTFKVSQTSRQRVLREKRKNVHAGVCGTVSNKASGEWIQISYNPYKFGYFYCVETLSPVLSARFVRFTDNKVYAILE